MADDEAGNSFQHLLAPIRDLVANWNVDIAADLGDYLDALEGITFAIDGETHGLNFAEGV
jgi:condensin-2 complex subunit H2